MTEILLARHGETDWNRDRRIQGQTDMRLNAAGLAQAHALAERLANEKLVAVHSSDLARARETAMIIAQCHRLEVTLDPGLREKNFGSWEGLTDSEIAVRFPDAVRGRWGDAETSEQVMSRAMAVIGQIRIAHADGPVLVVSHGGPLRMILEQLGVEHGSIGNCDVFRVEL